MSAQRIKAEKNISFSEAKKLAASSLTSGNAALRGNSTYAAVLKPSVKSIECQTDLTCMSAERPMCITDLSDSTPSQSSSTKTLKSSETQTSPPVVKQKNANVNYSKQKSRTDRVPKGQRDPVSILNRFDILEDMDVSSQVSTYSKSHSPKKKGRDLSPIAHPK